MEPRALATFVRTYAAPDRSVSELTGLEVGRIDALRQFGQCCRAEFDALRAEL